ncbi:MAG: phosphotransferase [Actinomycetota bacterium]|nr:phosphotransferase [Actinomycetota bacterium]
MIDLDERATAERFVQTLYPGATLLRASALEGGVSARVTALRVKLADGETTMLVARQHRAVAAEFRLLQVVRSLGLPAPAPFHLDESCEVLSTPVIVTEFIDGRPGSPRTNLADRLRQLASTLAAIHGTDSSKFDLTFLPHRNAPYDDMAAASRSAAVEPRYERHIREALRLASRLVQRNRSVLLHGDFWPGNTLWKDGRLVAVIDWDDAAFGDPLADVANARLEILFASGVEAMDAFTDEYRAAIPSVDFAHLPYWDLWADLRLVPRIGEWGLDDETERTMRERHALFVTQAFDRLPADVSGRSAAAAMLPETFDRVFRSNV